MTAIFSLAVPAYPASVTDISGRVYLMEAGRAIWSQITEKKTTVAGGDKVRTAARSRATVRFEDGSRIEIGPNASFTIETTGSKSNSIFMRFGFMRAWVARRVNQRFLVRTPTAVCSVRGTEFQIDVDRSGMTRVAMFSGILAVSDQAGNSVILRENQSISVDQRGLGNVRTGEQAKSPTERRRDRLKREVSLEMTKEQVQAAAAIEAKDAIFQEGKAIIDVNGKRVRIEEYIIRPQPDQFKLVVLNDRSDRFDFFYYKGTFNTILPDDISIALRMLPGCIGAACQYFLTGYETGRSNTIDNMLEVATGGHQVDVNNNVDANNNLLTGDDVTAAFDPATDKFSILAPGAIFFQTLYNTNTLTFNGVEHSSWKQKAALGAGDITNFVADTSGGDVTFTNVTTVQTNCGPPNCTFTESGVLHDVIYASNPDGTIWEKYDSYIINNEGEIAKTEDFSGLTTGTEYKRRLLDWNFQIIVTASEFQGRKIDLAVEPKIFIQSGLIP